jgi:hypothetical protein
LSSIKLVFFNSFDVERFSWLSKRWSLLWGFGEQNFRRQLRPYRPQRSIERDSIQIFHSLSQRPGQHQINNYFKCFSILGTCMCLFNDIENLLIFEKSDVLLVYVKSIFLNCSISNLAFVSTTKNDDLYKKCICLLIGYVWYGPKWSHWSASTVSSIS